MAADPAVAVLVQGDLFGKDFLQPPFDQFSPQLAFPGQPVEFKNVENEKTGMKDQAGLFGREVTLNGA